MKKTIMSVFLMLVVITVLVSGCAPASVPVLPTLTRIPPTATSTPISPTTTPQPFINIQGTIHFTGVRQDPFATLVVLHGKDDFTKTAIAQASADGKYSFSDIETGEYKLWVLISNTAEMIPTCSDVIFPDNTWIAGIQIDQTTVITTETTLLSKAIEVAAVFGSSGWVSYATGSNTATGIFAVSPVMYLTTDKTIELDIVLICQ